MFIRCLNTKYIRVAFFVRDFFCVKSELIEMSEKLSKGFFLGIISSILSMTGLLVTGQESGQKLSLHSLYGGVGFTSNMVYMGTGISQNKPVYSGSLTYGYKDELFLSASTFHLSAFDPFLAFHAFSFSYSHPVNSWFDYSFGFSRYQVAQSLTDTLFNSFFYGNLTLGFDWKILYTKISMGGVLSDEASAYLQIANSRYFETPDFINSRAFFSFDPYINMLFGSLTRTNTSEGTVIGVSRPFGSGKSDRNSAQETTTFFGLMEIDLGVPVAFNLDRFTLEAEPGYILPLYSDTELFNPEGFVFMINCFVKIF